MDYSTDTGLYTETIPAKKEGEEDTHRTVTEFTFEYANKNGHPIPETTVAIVPFRLTRDGALMASIGWTWCNHKDNPQKRKGRSIAQARALGVIKNTKGDAITTKNGRSVGFSCLAENISKRQLMREAEINGQTASRIMKSVEHLLKIV